MHEHEMDFEWDATVTRVYQEVVSASDPEEGTSRQEAFSAAAERLEQMVNDGELFVDVSQAIRAALSRADDTQGRAADAVIKRLVAGEASLDIEKDPTLNIVVKLGEGKRKPWRNITAADLRDMDALRYGNYRKQQIAYDEWRKCYDRALPVAFQYGTIGAAVAAGAFTAAEGAA